MTKVMIGFGTFSSAIWYLLLMGLMIRSFYDGVRSLKKLTNWVTMKIKLMPMLAGAIALSVVATPFIVNAQSGMSDQAQPTNSRRYGKWDKLNLSEQQKAQLQQIKNDTRTQIEAVLTPQQLEQLKTARQNNQANQAGQGHRGKHSAMAALNLTDAQKAKIKEIKDSQKARMQAILTPEQQQQLQQMHQQWRQQRQQQQQQQGN
jgi:periplasmic protein CpxP/Spy